MVCFEFLGLDFHWHYGKYVMDEFEATLDDVSWSVDILGAIRRI